MIDVSACGAASAVSAAGSFFTVLGKFPEALGAITFYVSRLRGRGAKIIEYK